MEKYFKIGEISKLYHIGPDSLRYYEKIGILKPKRGENQYRLYRTEDIWRLNVIRELRELGFSMEQIGVYLKDHTVSTTKALLEEELHMIQKKQEELRRLQRNVKERVRMLEECGHQEMGKVRLCHLPDRNCHYIEEGYRQDEEMDVLIKQLLNKSPETLYIIGSNRIGSVIPKESAGNNRCREYSGVFIIDANGDAVIRGGNYLTLSYCGDCGQNYYFLPKLLDYARENGYRMASDVYEILWVDIHVSERVEEHITELQFRVERENRNVKKRGISTTCWRR